jgi:hypothetical protein
VKIEILPMHDQSRNCYEDSVVSVALWWKRRYEMMFSESWGFTFDPQKAESTKILANGLFSNKCDCTRLLQYYHGVSVNYLDPKRHQEALAIIQNELNLGNPVLIGIDTFFCPWDMGFQQFHITHLCLAVGINYDDEKINFIDCFNIKKNISLSYDDFFKHCSVCATFELLPFNNVQLDDMGVVERTIKKLFYEHQIGNSFKMMREFGEHVRNANINYDFDDYPQIFNAPILIEVFSISKSRKQFAVTLKYLDEIYKTHKFRSAIKELHHIAQQWETVISLLTKAYHKSSDHKLLNRAADKINEISLFEEQLANAILQIF